MTNPYESPRASPELIDDEPIEEVPWTEPSISFGTMFVWFLVILAILAITFSLFMPVVT